MSHRMDIEAVETAAYRSRFDDGLLDCYLGFALIWMGAWWLLLEDLAGLAGILPAIAVVPFVAARTRFLEERAGHVRFSERRRSWERRRLGLFVGVGIVVLLLVLGAYVVVADGELTGLGEAIAPGLIAGIIACLVLAIAAITGVWRFVAYGALLGVGALVAAATDANPGAPLLAVGVVVLGWGLVLVALFLRRHPRMSEPVT